ncbi:MAG: hypothetical protein AMXMBFR48_09710 [Ignavibacteriales bacterium]
MIFDSPYLGPVLIALMRICDVSIGTVRTILVVQGRRYYAAFAGFFEVLIWVFAIRFIFQHLDNTANLFGYAIGFSLGNFFGITIERWIGLGHANINVISKFNTDKIADALRLAGYGVTIIPGEGGSGGVSIINCILPRKKVQNFIKLVESIDKEAFINLQSSIPYRGFMHVSRK